MSAHGMLLDIQQLQANLGMQGAANLLNNIYLISFIGHDTQNWKEPVIRSFENIHYKRGDIARNHTIILQSTLMDTTSQCIVVLKLSSLNLRRIRQPHSPNYRGRSESHIPPEVHQPHSSPAHHSLRRGMYDADAPICKRKRNSLCIHYE